MKFSVMCDVCIAMDRAMDRYGYVSNNYHPHAVPIAGHYHHKTAHMPASHGAYGGGAVQPPVIGQIGQQQEPIMRQPEHYRRELRAEMFSQEGRPWTTGILGCMEDCDSCTYVSCLQSHFFTAV